MCSPRRASLPEGGTLIATDELPCMHVLNTAPFPHRQADSQVFSRGGGGVGEALQVLRDALLSAVVGVEVSAMVSAISRGRRPRRRPHMDVHASVRVALALRPSSISAWEMASSDLSVGDRDAVAVPAGRFFPCTDHQRPRPPDEGGNQGG